MGNLQAEHLLSSEETFEPAANGEKVAVPAE
jgi:hypothetical protein